MTKQVLIDLNQAGFKRIGVRIDFGRDHAEPCLLRGGKAMSTGKQSIAGPQRFFSKE